MKSKPGKSFVDLVLWENFCVHHGKSLHRIFTTVTLPPAERIHTDGVIPKARTSLGNARYFATAVDEHSGFSLVRSIKRKIGTAIADIGMIREIENWFNLYMETLTCLNRSIVKWGRFDDRSGIERHQFQNLLKHCRIVYEGNTPVSTDSSWWAERLKRSLMDMVRKFMLELQIINTNFGLMQ